MTSDHIPAEAPPEWDHLAERLTGSEDGGLEPSEEERPGARRAALVLAALADLVTMLALCAAVVAALRVAGLETALVAVPWAAAVAVSWWLAAAAALLAVRRGTPGLLIGGLAFSEPVPATRLAPTLAVALLGACLLALPPALGGRRSLLEIAAGTAITGPAPSRGRAA